MSTYSKRTQEGSVKISRTCPDGRVAAVATPSGVCQLGVRSSGPV